MTKEMISWIELMLKLWPIFLFLLGLAFAWGGMFIRLREIEKKNKEDKKTIMQRIIGIESSIVGVESDMTSRLYLNSMPLFVPVKMCQDQHASMEKKQDKMETTFETKFRDIAITMKDSSTSIGNQFGEVFKKLTEISNMMMRHLGETEGKKRREEDK